MIITSTSYARMSWCLRKDNSLKPVFAGSIAKCIANIWSVLSHPVWLYFPIFPSDKSVDTQLTLTSSCFSPFSSYLLDSITPQRQPVFHLCLYLKVSIRHTSTLQPHAAYYSTYFLRDLTHQTKSLWFCLFTGHPSLLSPGATSLRH